MASKSKCLSSVLTAAGVVYMTGCSTLTGIPSHGGGKRFAQEQRLVSASVRSTLKNIDITPIKGKEVVLVVEMINDQGSGNINGGRLNFLAALTGGHSSTPVGSSVAQFQLFNLGEMGSSYSNTLGGSSSSVTTSSNFLQNYSGSNTQNGTTNTRTDTTGNNYSTGTTNGTQNIGGSSTTSITNNSNNSVGGAYSSTTTNSGMTTTTNNPTVVTTTSTGNVNTTQTTNANTGTQTVSPSTVTTNMPAVSNTSTGNSNTVSNTAPSVNSNNSTNTEHVRSDSISNAAQTSTSTGTSTQTTNSTTTGSNTERADNHSNRSDKSQLSREAVMASGNRTQERGRSHKVNVSLDYRGTGEYTNYNVPVSDGALLGGLIRNYMRLNGVRVMPIERGITPHTDAVVYVTVDIFGTVRSRFDAYAFNRESVIAETGIEMMAINPHTGEIVMSPRNANYEAKYDENYVLWTGPYVSNEIVRKGKGLLVDFSDVDGTKGNYPEKSTTQRRYYRNNAQ
ncbi:hypothetical protein [Conchiformibius steedae]|uniref:Adhesin n=1 Tax=Conchiformibius steedae TaxID=153493 RepID=A0A3P2A6L8_9NEIS|nr:hypothetical protein [Conchiformibius steedae]RRD91034.1 hypothetical protein EII21_03555 [Conchiformibius steedae]